MKDGKRAVVCRCENVDLETIRQYIADGYTDIEVIKRLLRTTMGRCQGKTCQAIILKEIAAATGVPLRSLKPTTFRPPTVSIPLKDIAKGVSDDH